MTKHITPETVGRTVRDTLSMGRRTQANYDAMVEFTALTPESDSATITAAARALVLTAYPDTDPERFKGKGKSDDARWVDARTVRKGLVDSLKRQQGDDGAESEPRVTALLTAAGRNATVEEVIAEWEAAQQNS